MGQDFDPFPFHELASLIVGPSMCRTRDWTPVNMENIQPYCMTSHENHNHHNLSSPDQNNQIPVMGPAVFLKQKHVVMKTRKPWSLKKNGKT